MESPIRAHAHSHGWSKGDCGEILFLEYFIGLRHIFQRARREGGSGKMGKVASVAAIILFLRRGESIISHPSILPAGVQDPERLGDPRLVHLALRQGPHELLHRHLLSGGGLCRGDQCNKQSPRLLATEKDVSLTVARTKHDIPVCHGVRRLIRQKLRHQVDHFQNR